MIMDNRKKIEEIVIDCIQILGEEESIKEFKPPNLSTEIRKIVDSMSLVALSVDIEEKYEEAFDKEIRVLDEENENFLLNFESVETLVDHICKL